MARDGRNSRTVRAIGPVAAGIAWLVLVVVMVRAQAVDNRIEPSRGGSLPAMTASSEESNRMPLALPDAALIAGDWADAAIPAPSTPEHAPKSEATVAAPSQDRRTVVLSYAAAAAASRSDQSKSLDGAAALGPTQSDPKAGSPAAAPAQAQENEPSLAAEEASEKPALSNEPGPSTDEAGEEPAQLAEAAAEQEAAERAAAERAAAEKAAAEKQAAGKSASPDANGRPGAVAVKGSVGPAEGGEAGLVFRIELSRPAERTIVLIYGTVDGTAKAGQDYEPRQGIITLPPGDTNADVYVPLKEGLSRKDDARFELFLTADPEVAEVVDQRITAVIPLARPHTALIPGSQLDAGGVARLVPEHASRSEATVAAPSQDRRSVVLSDAAAAAASRSDQRRPLDGAAALGPNQSDPKAGSPAAAPAQAQENEPSLAAEQESEKPALSDEPRPSMDGAGQEPAHFAATARLHSVASEQASSEPSTSKPSTSERSGASSAGIRIFIHYARSDVASADLARRLAGYLQRVGFSVADIRTVDFRIVKPSVRYFFEDDRNDSWRLLDELGRFFKEAPSRAPDQASDFTHFIPKPRLGNVEVWLPTS